MMNSYSKSIFSTLIFLLVAACSRNEPPSDVIYTRVFNPYHMVEPGESVESISKKYNMSEQDLIAINSLQAPYTLIPGQRILVHKRADEIDQKEDVETQQLDGAETAEGQSEGLTDLSEDKGTEISSEINDSSSSPDTNKFTTQTDSTYTWPVKGRILKGYGLQKGGEVSNGITIAAPEGTPVVAIKAGEVKYANSTVEGYGKMVIIRHPDGMMSTYAHMKDFATGIKPGKNVAGGAKIGRVGKTGCTRPQLQLQVRGKDRKPINPLSLLK